MSHTLIGFHTTIAARAYDLLHQLMPYESAHVLSIDGAHS